MERLVGNDSAKIVGLRLRRMRSSELCKRILRKKAQKSGNDIDENLLIKKAEGLSAAIDSAMGYLETETSDLNSKVLSRYYGLMQLTIAEQVSSLKNKNDLALIQTHTESGHGLGTFRNKKDDKNFPSNFYVHIVNRGHFYQYTKSLNVTVNSFAFEGRQWKFQKVDDKKYVSLLDLFRRIPELKEVIPEYFDMEPLTFLIRREPYTQKFKNRFNKEIDTVTGSTQTENNTKNKRCEYIQIYPQTKTTTLEKIRSYAWPFSGILEDYNEFEKKKYFVGRLYHEGAVLDYTRFFYRSDYSLFSYIVPIFQTINDPVLINLMLTYALSIIVRYMPDTWHKIQKYDLNHLGSLIEYYISIFDQVVPMISLARITGEEIYIKHLNSSYASPVITSRE
ncbi:hypothetical protein CEE37_13355 [candidate division LCP-89 bacterium B3_LCP]|uniref:Uncharacterized protein n=1 Tax=candidate division LCP-89 bacterium B3_LCP TaxID=2012998 RepID=A0A532USQ4_UNCL8|nr:MAG: hypothetical protein CEE37_13355 [candidate division LCP-89 bacterium B3_LCP]